MVVFRINATAWPAQILVIFINEDIADNFMGDELLLNFGAKFQR